MKREIRNGCEMGLERRNEAPAEFPVPGASNDRPGFAGRLVVFCRMWMERFALRRGSSAHRLAVVARLELGGKKSLLIVQCGSQRILVAQGAATITAMMDVSGRRRQPICERGTPSSRNSRPFRDANRREGRRRIQAAALREGSGCSKQCC
jgi:hypothetical protein